MSQQTTDKLVASYLKTRGFKQAENALKVEAKIKDVPSAPIDSIPDFLLFHSEKELSDPLAFEKSYGALRKWTFDSIDFYKSELEPVLYPIYVHCYLDLVSKGMKDQARSFLESFKSDHMDMHSHDISRLGAITEEYHVLENDLAQSYRNSRFGIVMSRYPFELLLGYLQDQGFMHLLRIVNQYLNIQVTNEKPSDHLHQEKSAGLLGKEENMSSLVAEYPVSLGKSKEDPVFVKELEKAIADPQLPDGPLLMQEFQQWNTMDADAPDPMLSVPLPPRKLLDIQKEIEEFRQARDCVALGRGVLPSICCYTFHNTRDGLISLEMSNDGSMIAGGFDDSFIKLWNLEKELPPKNTRNEMKQSGDKFFTRENVLQVEIAPVDASVKLIGHSGPVYASSFSPDNRFLLSCSEDKTARLWSLDTFKNVAVFKGHNYPIWDIELGPCGFYFATASHDRTARLWSTDHIYALRVFVGHLSDVEVVKFHPNSNYLFTGSSDRTCRMWDIQRGTTIRMFTGHVGPVSSLAVSPDGKSVVSATNAGLCQWDLSTGKKLKNLVMSNRAQVHSIEFSRDGQLIAAGCGDETVRIWDAKTEAQVVLLIFCLKFSFLEWRNWVSFIPRKLQFIMCIFQRETYYMP